MIRLRALSAAPKRVVHGCFLLVFLLLTLLTWREAVILKEDYEITKRDQLETTSNTLERFGQRSTDELIFYRNLMRRALQSPVKNSEIAQLLAQFEQQRDHEVWHLSPGNPQAIPVEGVADRWVKQHDLLNRDDALRLQDELTATLGISMLLQIEDPRRNFHSRIWYISRGGFFLSSSPTGVNTLESYARMVSRPYFTRMTPQANPERKMLWTGVYDGLNNQGKAITTSIPLDHHGYWYGVLAMDFSLARLRACLQQALPPGISGNVMIFNRNMELVVESDRLPLPGHSFSPEERKKMLSAVADRKQGTLRFGSRFVIWTRSHQFHWVLVNIQTLKEGVAEETGRASMVLIVMWLLFGAGLILCHQLIIRLFDRMLTLQDTLSWRANYDSLTRLLNRGAFFEKAEQLAHHCKHAQLPFSVIQMDLDRFKSVNDTWGHQAGDLVLSHAAATIQSAIRTKDVAGRIGGEEFCLALPATGLEEAVEIAERVRQKLASKEVLIDTTRTLTITVSIGVASSEEQQVYQFESLQSVADSRLYQAKTAGRNRVCAED
ncbi:cellulose biosynthesis regulator diguanylate cyclase DgcQ [Erwinia sp. MMLR14_017]|uniref:cellulose biosynthesis regulator diguanylate cyclase DgcQ n=1 Tax=Erwinia sp. MMLR14_017 TaxID=3093842 RepID=UPI00298FDA91|nr:cellulose biosynthesis regulator diguanylate cyclase DgcQ [Erwinia sp. MMLR14_017]MDW8846698.1 cellulose biosynthesis regulator diguanylate cyclase DgcQ [Erwinia sp. MMLR14_017]